MLDDKKIKEALLAAFKEIGITPTEIYISLSKTRNPYITTMFEADEQGEVIITE